MSLSAEKSDAPRGLEAGEETRDDALPMVKASKQLSLELASLERAEKQVKQIRQRVQQHQREQLKALHEELGFDSTKELIDALQEFVVEEEVLRYGLGVTDPQAKGRAATVEEGRKKPTYVTPELRKSIVAAIKAGNYGKHVAAEFNVSLPTINNIKREEGLSKTRKKTRKR